MSLTAQALYMHLLANADDDGCVDAYTITRMIGAKEDDLVLLKERDYITVLDEKEYILWITAWQDFNWIEPRYKEDSKYLPLLRSKVEGLEIVESTKHDYNKRRYAERKMQKQINDASTREVHSVHTVDTPGSTRADHHLGKVRKGKERIGETEKTISKEIVPFSNGYSLWMDEWIKAMGFPITKSLKENENALKSCIKDSSAEVMHQVIAYLHFLKTTKKAKERPHWFQYTTSFVKIRSFWDHIQAGMTDDAFQLAKAGYGDELFTR